MINAHAQHAIVILVEPGSLEKKAALFLESLSRNAPQFSGLPLYVMRPRIKEGKVFKPYFFESLKKYPNVTYLEQDLNVGVWRNYGPMNKPYAFQYLENMLTPKGVEFITFFDTDVLLFQDPVLLTQIASHQVVAIKPEDCAKVAAKPGQPINALWQIIYELCDVSAADLWTVTSTSDNQEIYAYYNSGVVTLKLGTGLIASFIKNVELIGADPRLHQLEPDLFNMSEQAIFSATIAANHAKNQVLELPGTYNYPYHLHRGMPADHRIRRFEDAVVLHYHHEFDLMRKVLKDGVQVSEYTRSWLLPKLPLKSMYSVYEEKFKKRFKRMRSLLKKK